MPITLRSALRVSPEAERVLDRYAGLMGRASRGYFRERHVRKRSVAELKREFQIRWGVTARQFNGIRFAVDGQVAGAVEAHSRHRDEVRERLGRKRRQLRRVGPPRTTGTPGPAVTASVGAAAAAGAAPAARGGSRARRRHQLKREIQRQEHTLARLSEPRPVPPLCFGTKRLFQAQFNLAENGYASHAAWKDDWTKSRNSRITLVGSHDEAAGNQSCQIHIGPDGRGTARLRLPDGLVKTLEAEGAQGTGDPAQGTDGAPAQPIPRVMTLPVHFAYGVEQLLWALQGARSKDEKGRGCRKGNAALTVQIFRRRKTSRRTGRPKGRWRWYLHVSFEPNPIPVVTDVRNGALGVDLNAGMLAAAHLDPSGNPTRTFQVPVHTIDRRKDQIRAAVQAAAKTIVAYAEQHRIPVVIESLDFTRKKRALREEGVPYRRMLSGLAYAAMGEAIRARAAKHGVEVREVDPAYTSVIGRQKFAEGYGLSVHEAAAAVIGRRAMNLRKVVRRQGEHPRARSGRRTSGYATLAPARMRGVHVREDWGRIMRSQTAARRTRVGWSVSAHSGGGAAPGTVPACHPGTRPARSRSGHVPSTGVRPPGTTHEHCSRGDMDKCPTCP